MTTATIVREPLGTVVLEISLPKLPLTITPEIRAGVAFYNDDNDASDEAVKEFLAEYLTHGDLNMVSALEHLAKVGRQGHE
jgi:hypothetical protein